jgi:hypothetical protein
MSAILADDRTVIERLLNHIDRKTTDMSEDVWLEPVEHYTSVQRTGASAHADAVLSLRRPARGWLLCGA